MKKWMNTLFFGGCFIVAILLEAYGMIAWKGSLFSVIALGLVVLITGYLFMDSIKSRLMQGSENARFYVDRLLNEESEKWGERHTEMVNLQKASYTATKKNAAMQMEQFNEVLTRLENLEDNNARTLQKIIELQKTSLEGQKNALNLELSYLKDHTKRIIGAMKEDNHEGDLKDALTDVLAAVEENNRLLREQMEQGKNTQGQLYHFNDDPFPSYEDNRNDYITSEETPTAYAKPSVNRFTEDTGYVEDEQNKPSDDIVNILQGIESLYSTEQLQMTEDTEVAEEAEAQEDPAEEHVEEYAAENVNEYAEEHVNDYAEKQIDEYTEEHLEENVEETSLEEAINTYDFYNELSTTDHIEDELVEETGELIEDNAPEADWSIQDEPVTEAEDTVDTIEEPMKTITPLYDDPNKALTADEIAALFASFGK